MADDMRRKSAEEARKEHDEPGRTAEDSELMKSRSAKRQPELMEPGRVPTRTEHDG